MDNITHTLTGLAISQAGFNRKTRFATLAIVAGSMLPDADIVASIGGAANYLKYHRGFTHSILGVTVLGWGLAAVIYYLGRNAKPKKDAPPLDWRWLVAACWVATTAHLLMDFTNAYGVRLFLPFSDRWYAWDIVNIIDPVLLLVLVLGLGFPALFRLVSAELGAQKPGYRHGAIFALAGMLVLWGLRDFSHRRALSQLDSHVYDQEYATRMGAFPAPIDPFAWKGVVETDSSYYVLPVSALASDIQIDQAHVYHKPDLSPAAKAAMATRTARIFLDFARFPLLETDETEDGFNVRIRDLRFMPDESRRSGFVVEVELDKDLKVKSESFSFAGPTRRTSR